MWLGGRGEWQLLVKTSKLGRELPLGFIADDTTSASLAIMRRQDK